MFLFVMLHQGLVGFLWHKVHTRHTEPDEVASRVVEAMVIELSVHATINILVQFLQILVLLELTPFFYLALVT